MRRITDPTTSAALIFMNLDDLSIYDSIYWIALSVGNPTDAGYMNLLVVFESILHACSWGRKEERRLSCKAAPKKGHGCMTLIWNKLQGSSCPLWSVSIGKCLVKLTGPLGPTTREGFSMSVCNQHLSMNEKKRCMGWLGAHTCHWFSNRSLESINYIHPSS